MSDSVGKQKIGAMPLDTLLGGMRQIIEKELQPLRQRITSLEVENRALRARVNAKGQGGASTGRFQPLRRP